MVDQCISGEIWVIWVERASEVSAALDLDSPIRFILRHDVWSRGWSQEVQILVHSAILDLLNREDGLFGTHLHRLHELLGRIPGSAQDKVYQSLHQPSN